jgi:hypothetical protein
MKPRILLPFWFFIVVCSCYVGANNLYFKADSIKAHVEPTMYGIFFEDINMAADGGVYAELVKNRSFEFTPNLMGWSERVKDGGSGSVKWSTGRRSGLRIRM